MAGIDTDFRNQWIDVQQEQGVELQECEKLETPAAIDGSYSLPAVKVDENNNPVSYVQIPYSVLSQALATMNSAAAASENINAVLNTTTGELTVTDRTG